MIARFLCRLFGHVRRILLVEEMWIRGLEGVYVTERCPRCRVVLDKYHAPF